MDKGPENRASGIVGVQDYCDQKIRVVGKGPSKLESSELYLHPTLVLGTEKSSVGLFTLVEAPTCGLVPCGGTSNFITECSKWPGNFCLLPGAPLSELPEHVVQKGMDLVGEGQTPKSCP